jgi:hypothetical protein
VRGIRFGGIAFGGEDADGNRIMTVSAMPLESRLTLTGLTKQAIEDLQFHGFYGVAQLCGAAGSLEHYERVTNDPPDLRVKAEGRPLLNVELTTLPASEISRERLAEIRLIARKISERLSADSARFAHLNGRTVFIAEMGDDTKRPPK